MQGGNTCCCNVLQLHDGGIWQPTAAFPTLLPLPAALVLDSRFADAYSEVIVQLSFNKEHETAPAKAGGGVSESLASLLRGEEAVLASIDLPEETAQRLMELGFLPGTAITASGSAPGGDPRVYRVDGSEVALRVELARKLIIRPRLGPD